MQLSANEQVTLVTLAGGEYDVARKSWGFYATPSLNSRLQRFGLRAVLMKCPEEGRTEAKYFIYLIERGHEPGFEDYIKTRGYSIVCWLDETSALQNLEHRMQGAE